jgi:signal transduction histidine kinase
MSLDPVPVGSRRGVVVFAAIRVLVVAAGLVSLAFVDFRDEAAAVVVGAAIGLPWALAVLALSWRAPGHALTPFVALGDIAVLSAGLALVPDLYGVVRYIGLFIFAAHAHFQGERRGLVIAGVGGAAIVIVSALVSAPIPETLTGLYDVVYVLCSLAVALVVGRLRTFESQERLRAEETARRTLEVEDAVRRRVATSIHDGPVQQLVSLDMVLAAAEHDAARGEGAGGTLAEARRLAHSTLADLRDEVVSLTRAPTDDTGFHEAIERAAPMWGRRYGIAVELDLEPIELSSPHAGALFGIAQEAVVNAGRHAHAHRVTVRLRRDGSAVELRVGDDGSGFGESDPLADFGPDHLGMATMRERAAMLDGELRVDSSDGGTEVIARAPLEGGRAGDA